MVQCTATKVSQIKLPLGAMLHAVRRLASAAGITGGGMLAYSLSQWAAVAIAAQAYGVDTAGRYALATAVSTPIFTLLGLNLRTVCAAGTLADQQKGHLSWLRYTTLSVAGICSSAACMVLGSWKDSIEIACLVIVLKVLDGISDLNYGELQRRNQFARIAWSQLWRGGSLCAGVSFSAWQEQPFQFGLTIAALGWLLVILWIERDQVRNPRTAYATPRGRLAACWELFRTYIPLGCAVGLLQLNNSVGRIIIARVSGDHTVGIFACLYYVVFVPHLIVTALGQRMTPSFGARVRANDWAGVLTLSRRLLLYAIVLHGAILALALLVGGRAMHVLYGPEFVGQVTNLVFVALFGGTSVYVATAGYALTAAGIYRDQVSAFATGIVVNCGITIALVHYQPILAASLGLAASNVVTASMCSRRLRQAALAARPL